MNINIYKTVKIICLKQKAIKDLLQKILQKNKKSAAGISIHFIGDKKMRSLNYLYRGKDKTTDVLAFAMRDKKQLKNEEQDLGDLFINIPQVRRQAKQYGISCQEELARMITHGTLHLLGHDHQKMGQAKKMFSLQEKIIKEFL